MVIRVLNFFFVLPVKLQFRSTVLFLPPSAVSSVSTAEATSITPVAAAEATAKPKAAASSTTTRSASVAELADFVDGFHQVRWPLDDGMTTTTAAGTTTSASASTSAAPVTAASEAFHHDDTVAATSATPEDSAIDGAQDSAEGEGRNYLQWKKCVDEVLNRRISIRAS